MLESAKKPERKLAEIPEESQYFNERHFEEVKSIYPSAKRLIVKELSSQYRETPPEGKGNQRELVICVETAAEVIELPTITFWEGDDESRESAGRKIELKKLLGG